MRCDDGALVYVDGVLVGSTEEQDEVWRGEVSSDAQLIAVLCANTGGAGGLLVSMGDFLVSNTKWKCSKNVEKDGGWYRVNFNDSAWNSAYKIGDNDGSLWKTLPAWKQTSFPASAQWIWTDDQWEKLPAESATDFIYCRRRTGKTCSFCHEAIKLTSLSVPCITLHLL